MILLFSVPFITQHIARLRNVFERLRSAGLKLKPNKCRFAFKSVKYLGHVVSSEGIHADPAKTEVISNYPVPKNVNELNQFLGLTNYYRRFVRDYAKIAAPLHKLRQKNVHFFWNISCQEAFQELKQQLVSPPILAYPSFSDPFVLSTDASDGAIGGILSQVKDGKEHVIAYYSRQLQKAEREYSTIEKEALAVISLVKEFYPYLYGFHFKLVTDHNPLTALKGVKDYGGRLTRWMLFLMQFDYEMEYKPGRTHNNADALSRLPPVGDAINVIQDVCPLNRMQQAQAVDKCLQPIITALKNHRSLPTSVAPGLRKVFLLDGTLCRHFGENSVIQVIVPDALKENVLEQLHDRAGHLGRHKTMEKVKQRFYWPGYEDDIKFWIQNCLQCQQRNPPVPLPQAPMETIQVNYPFEKISWDIMGPLPVTHDGNKYILVVTDLFTKWVEAFPLKETSSVTLAKVLVDEVICRFGVPKSIHSDQGANFCSEVIVTMCKMLNIERTQTSAYHPQGNGQVERFNRTIEAMLSKVVQNSQKDWDSHIPKALLAYRSAVHESTKFTPYHLVFGRSPGLPVDVFLGRAQSQEEFTSYPEFIRKVHQTLNSTYSEVNQHLREAYHQRKRFHQQSKKLCDFQCGDRVWLHVPAIKRGRTKSLWRGPYTVMDKTSSVNYRIQLIGSTKSIVVHRNRLKLCFGEPQQSKKSPVPQQNKPLSQDRAGINMSSKVGSEIVT